MSEMNQAEIANIARGARDVLGKTGWCKGYLELSSLSGTRHCIGGALNVAATGEAGWATRLQPVYEAARAIMEKEFPEVTELATGWDRFDATALIAYWNNHPATTREHIDVVLEKLAVA